MMKNNYFNSLMLCRNKLGDIARRAIQYPVKFFEIIIMSKSVRASRFEASPIFIIGAPRTGSTILYQALTNYCDLCYIDNLACKWHRNLLFGLWLSNKKFKNKPHNNFHAEHGATHKYGGHAPSECGGFWYRWLPKTHHFIDEDDIDANMIKEMQAEISGVTNYFKKPILFKNLNAGQRLRLIVRAFPNAKFIYIKRDPVFVIQSILKARKKDNVKPGTWWSVKPANYKQLLLLPEEEMISNQVYYIEKQIEEDLELFPCENVKVIHFKDLSSEMISGISNWIGVSALEGGNIPEFKKDNIKKLDKIQKNLSRLYETLPFSETK